MKRSRLIIVGLFATCILCASIAAGQPEPQEATNARAPVVQNGGALPSKAVGANAKPAAQAPSADAKARPHTEVPSKSDPTAKSGSAEIVTARAQPGTPPVAVKLKDLEQKVEELKEDLLRQHVRFETLGTALLQGSGISHARFRFENDLSLAFIVTRALVVLDGNVLFEKRDAVGNIGIKQIPMFDGLLPAGDHTVQVLVNLRGNGYGVFSYLKDFTYDVRSSHSFTLPEESTMTIDVSTFEKESIVGKLEDRPAVRFDDHLSRGLTALLSAIPHN